MRPRLAPAIGAFFLGAASPTLAGPPYQTDDPEPTELGHWEIYNFAQVDGLGHSLDGTAGIDLNYGGAKGLQLTATLPIAFAHAEGANWQVGRGDVELAAKYRFLNDKQAGWQAAIFPRVFLPASSNKLGGTRVRLLLPLWVQKDIGKTSIFGGGGYEINPGPGNRDFWQAGIAVTHDFSDRLSLGTEIAWQSPDSDGVSSTTGVNVGLIRKLGGPFALLLSGGPSFSRDGTG